jgi:hypothetical protein
VDNNPDQTKRKKSSVKHTRAVQHDRSQRVSSIPSEEAIRDRLDEIVHPATLTQIGLFQRLGLRARTLTLPVIVGLVLSLIWRQLGSVCELARVVNREAVLWVPRMKISQQAINGRLRALPAQLFLNVLLGIVPDLQERWEGRHRPLPAAIAWACARYTQVSICDGSTLDALLRKVGLLQDLAAHPLAGRITAVLDAGSRLPTWVGYTSDATSSDQAFWDAILSRVQAGAMLIFDLGYTNYARFAQMTGTGITFVTRAKSNMAYTVAQVLARRAAVHDEIVWIGDVAQATRQQVRLIEVLFRGQWYRYISNELDAQRLPADILVALYWQRWRVEEAFGVVKSLLGLAYFFCGAQNAVEVQVWATWLLYAILVDLCDAVAEALQRPFADISMEMVYRSLYHFVRAHNRGEADDLIAFLVADSKLLGLVKRPRRPTPTLRYPPLTDGADA